MLASDTIIDTQKLFIARPWTQSRDVPYPGDSSVAMAPAAHPFAHVSRVSLSR